MDRPQTSDAQRAQHEEERALFARYARDSSPRARDAIVERFLPLARQLARRYAHGTDVEDLEQVAALGLIKAIERFDPERGLRFSSFAFPTVAGEIKRYLRDRSWSVRPPRDLQDTVLRIDRATSELGAELGRAPTAAELAARLDVTVEDVLEARQATTARHAVSLDAPVGGDGEGDESLGSRVAVRDPGFARVEQSAVVEALTRVLTERERLLLRLRFEEDLTQSEIGKRVGLSQMHVSRILRGAIEKLQASAAER